MFAVGSVDWGSPTPLYTVDLGSRQASLVGTIDVQKPAANLGLGTSSTGVLYMDDTVRDGIRCLDALKAFFLGPAGVDAGLFDGLTIDWSRDDALYHATWNRAASRTELWTVDRGTGAGSFVGVIGDGHRLFGDLAIAPVPEPATVLLLAALSIRPRRRCA